MTILLCVSKIKLIVRLCYYQEQKFKKFFVSVFCYRMFTMQMYFDVFELISTYILLDWVLI